MHLPISSPTALSHIKQWFSSKTWSATCGHISPTLTYDYKLSHDHKSQIIKSLMIGKPFVERATGDLFLTSSTFWYSLLNFCRKSALGGRKGKRNGFQGPLHLGPGSAPSLGTASAHPVPAEKGLGCWDGWWLISVRPWVATAQERGVWEWTTFGFHARGGCPGQELKSNS